MIKINDVIPENGELDVSAMKKFIIDNGWNLVWAVVILIMGFAIAKSIKGLVKKILTHEKFNNSAAGILSQIVYLLIVFITILIAIGITGIPISSMATIIGAIGIAVGFILKDSLSNVASGILIIFFHPFRVGDVIEQENGQAGTVMEIQLMNTIITQLDGKHIIIPNSSITNNRLTNYTRSLKRRIDIKVQISYESDYKKALALLKDLYYNDPKVLKDPEPFLGLNSFDDNGITLCAMPWVNKNDYFETRFRLMGKIKECFDKNGIEFPYPQRVLHIKRQDEDIKNINID